MFKKLLIFLSAIAAVHAQAGDKIKYYFNHPVDNSVAHGVNAVYLNSCFGDTLVAYINRAKYSLDIAVYNYTSSYPAIATAINNAYSRGVQVRWIYDSSSSNTGMPLVNPAINRLASPAPTGPYNIMHNKFMVVDAISTNPDDPIVWTGSSNWNTQQFNYDYNNIIILQDSALAAAYRAEFNMMWGGNGLAPTPASKFGPFKTDLGAHNFTIEGHHVELYFSPSDNTTSHFQSALSSADKDLYFGIYTFTDNSTSGIMVSRHNAGVYVAGIEDQSSDSYTPYTALTSALGTASFKVYSGSNLYHNKFSVIDPSDVCSDPQVTTGSYNWSIAANTKNDENMLIIHSDTAANVYYQAFRGNFSGLGGSLTTVSGCLAATPVIEAPQMAVSIYPNPGTGSFTIAYNNPATGKVRVQITDMPGKIVVEKNLENIAAGPHKLELSIAAPGMYICTIVAGTSISNQKILISK